jgi:hypothetical protein
VAAGGTGGGIAGALIGMGIPEYEAKRYEGKIREGNILISVHAENSDEVSRAKDVFKSAGAEDISYTGEEGVTDHSRDASYQTSAPRSTHSYDTEPYTSYEPGFRQDFAAMHGVTGRQYSDYEPAYQYGYTLATDPRYRDRDWDVLEPEARRGWAEHGRGTWEEFKDAVRRARDRVRGRRLPQEAA